MLGPSAAGLIHSQAWKLDIRWPTTHLRGDQIQGEMVSVDPRWGRERREENNKELDFVGCVNAESCSIWARSLTKRLWKGYSAASFVVRGACRWMVCCKHFVRLVMVFPLSFCWHWKSVPEEFAMSLHTEFCSYVSVTWWITAIKYYSHTRLIRCAGDKQTKNTLLVVRGISHVQAR